MQWSQLKKRIEATFAETVAGRVTVGATRYRGAHDGAAESWIAIDGVRLWRMSDLAYQTAVHEEAERQRRQTGSLDVHDSSQAQGYYDAHRQAQQAAQSHGLFSAERFNRALFDYLNLASDAAVASSDPIIRALAFLDRRFGKRRLARFDDAAEHPLVKALFRFRLRAEGMADPTAPSARVSS